MFVNTTIIVIIWYSISDLFLNSGRVFLDGDLGLWPSIDCVWPNYECSWCTLIWCDGCSNRHVDDREEVVPEGRGESEKASFIEKPTGR